MTDRSGLPNYGSLSLHDPPAPTADSASGSGSGSGSGSSATQLTSPTESLPPPPALGPSLTEEERKELDKALKKGFKVGMLGDVKSFCSIEELIDHLTLLNLFDRLKDAICDEAEYFPYPDCRGPVQADEAGIDAPPPPYTPVAEPPPTDAKRPRTEQEVQDAVREMSVQIQRERRWKIYLSRASYRLELWLAHILKGQTEALADDQLPDALLPPLDVALVLHSYYLNPLRLLEDKHRLQSRVALRNVSYPLRQLASRADPNSPTLNHMGPARDLWTQLVTLGSSKQPFDLPLQPPNATPTAAQEHHGGTNFGVPVKCPACRQETFVPWTGSGKDARLKGLGESGWERECRNAACGHQVISDDTTQMARFLLDHDLWRKSVSRRVGNTLPFFMAGSMIDLTTGKPHESDGAGEYIFKPLFKDERAKNSGFTPRRKNKSEVNLQEIRRACASFGYSLSAFHEYLQQALTGPNIVPVITTNQGKDRLYARIANLIASYQCGNSATYGPGLMDMVVAVNTQQGFNKDMRKLGWSTDRNLLASTEMRDLLGRSLIRYHKWLDLMAYSLVMLSPTLDIDLCWHTHQLKASYKKDTESTCGRFVNRECVNTRKRSLIARSIC